MTNWDKHRPKGMSVEELKNRTAAGLAEWERKGWIRPGFQQKQLKGLAIAKAEGPHLDRVGRKRVMQAANLAIYALANGDRHDYVGAMRVINATRRLAGMSSVFMQAMGNGISEAAAFAMGEKDATRLDHIARTWLHQDLNPGAGVGRQIFLPSKGANDDGKEGREAGSAGAEGEAGEGRAAGDQAREARGADLEPEPLAGEGGQGAGREGGPDADDAARAGGDGSVPPLERGTGE